MGTLYKENWPKGWTPNADNINGDPAGLLRADNLTPDEYGVLSLIRGTQKVSNQLFDAPTQLYGKMLDLNSVIDSPGGYPNGNLHVRYAVIGNQVLRNYSPANKREDMYDLGVIAGGGDQGAAFGFGSGHVFITYGAEKWKDSGVIRTRLGMNSPNPPGVGYNSPPTVAMRYSTPNYGEFGAHETGLTFVNTGDYVEMDSNIDSNRAIAWAGSSNGIIFTIDGNTLTGPNGSGKGLDEDIFTIYVRIGDTSKLVKVRVEYLMQPPPDATDYFYFEWVAGSDNIETSENTTFFNPGINSWTTLQCLRKNFQRYGTLSSASWSNIQGIRISFVTIEQQTFAFTDPKFIGGTKGPLNGQYTYIQVDVQDNGYYLEKSIPSAGSEIVNSISTSNYVMPNPVNPEANQCWIYRSLADTPIYYRVKVLAGAKGFSPPQFNDEVSDEQALLLNEPLDVFQSNLPDGVIGMETNFKGRNWYITYERIYPSYRDNVSSYDTRYVLDTAGNTEYNLFITKLSNDALILATNRDFYEITGTAGIIFQDNIEIFDMQIRSLGIMTPSISKQFAVREGKLFYLASDGLRVLAGSSCELFSTQLDLLFNHYNRHGIAPVKVIPMDLYFMGIGNNRFYFSCPQEDNKRALFIYNFTFNSWRFEEHGNSDSISALFVEEDNTVIYSTATFGDKYVRILDVGERFDQANNINFTLLTVFDHNGAPRNRKDAYTAKATLDTGNVPVNIIIRAYVDSSTILTSSTTLAFNGRTEIQWPVYDALTKVKYFQFEINGTVPKLKIYNLSIDYDQRPTQLTTLRIMNSDFGVAGRKRIPEIPMMIDTLGFNVNFVPIVDNIAREPATFSTPEKSIYNYPFPYNIAGYNVGGLLTAATPGGIFEFYDLIKPREVELLPDPVLYKWVPYTNLGTASRKRFIQYALVIDTRGQNVIMQPLIDSIAVAGAAKIINTNDKRTVITTMPSSAIGVDIACTLTATTGQTFEFYQVNLDESVYEKLPPLARYLTLQTTNYGTAAKKRIRTIPMVIDTRGFDVKFTPIVDGVTYPSSTFNTNDKRTVLHYFENTGQGTPFGIDYGGTLEGNAEFEFYTLLQPENVETLPVGKKFDQFGPVEFTKVGKIREISIRMVATGSNLNFKIFASDNPILSGSIPTVVNREKTYVISCPKGVNPNIFRMEIDSPAIFHRFDSEVKINIDGAQTENKRVRIK